jgi:tRNA-splicing endonuclease subunit Sen34
MESTLEATEPFPIFLVRNRYFLFDPNTVDYARKEHRIIGVLLGNIPRSSQQNVFNGLPLCLLPEEAYLLVTSGHAYIIDDVSAHRKSLLPDEEQTYLADLQIRGLHFAKERHIKAKSKTKHPLKDLSNTGESHKLEALPITPTTSYPPLKASPPNPSLPLPSIPKSYPLFKLLHSKGYFTAPGLRFGCTYSCYPGDPLRYHRWVSEITRDIFMFVDTYVIASHFLVVSKQWDEPFELIDIVGGGRLSTGVKKSWLIGGEVPEENSDEDSKVRTFCFEWAQM